MHLEMTDLFAENQHIEKEKEYNTERFGLTKTGTEC